MKRGDNVSLDELNLPPAPYRNEVFFGKGGNIVDEASAFVKVLTVGKWEVYFIWFWRNILFDPYGSDILKRTQGEHAKLKKVSKETYDLYIKYLKTKNSIYLTKARRMAMESK